MSRWLSHQPNQCRKSSVPAGERVKGVGGLKIGYTLSPSWFPGVVHDIAIARTVTEPKIDDDVHLYTPRYLGRVTAGTQSVSSDAASVEKRHVALSKNEPLSPAYSSHTSNFGAGARSRPDGDPMPPALEKIRRAAR